MDPVYMTKMASSFIDELTGLRKLARESLYTPQQQAELRGQVHDFGSNVPMADQIQQQQQQFRRGQQFQQGQPAVGAPAGQPPAPTGAGARPRGTPPPIPADAAKGPGMFTRGRQAMGEGFQTMGNVVGGSGPMAQRLGAPAGQTFRQHMQNVWEGGKIPTMENVAGKAGQAGKTVVRGGGLLGGLKAVAGTRFGKMLGAVGGVAGAGYAASKLLSRPQPAYPQGY